MTTKPGAPSLDQIMRSVTNLTGYTVAQLQGRHRLSALVAARKLVITEATAAGHSQSAIGRALNRHPSSIHYMIRTRSSPMAKKPAPPPKKPPTDWTKYNYAKPTSDRPKPPERSRVIVTAPGGEEIEPWSFGTGPQRAVAEVVDHWQFKAEQGIISRMGLDAVVITCGDLTETVRAGDQP